MVENDNDSRLGNPSNKMKQSFDEDDYHPHQVGTLQGLVWRIGGVARMRGVVMVKYAVVVVAFLIDFSNGKTCIFQTQKLIGTTQSWSGEVSSPQTLPTGLLKEVSLRNVTLDPQSVYGRAQQTNLEYLLMFNVDNLVWSFRKTAGLPTPGTPYGGWEAPNMELRGHFVGHYLSASAKIWASTQSDSIKRNMDALVAALAECQAKMKSGYLSAFPEEFFDRLENLKINWSPYYAIHKIMAGLWDQYEIASNAQALDMVSSMAEYFFHRVQNVINNYGIDRHWSSIDGDIGGMNDVLYKLYAKTGVDRFLILANRLNKPCFVGMLASKVDELSNLHADTHIPIVIGSQTRYEVVGDPLYKDVATYFMDIVNASHSYVTGGSTNSDFWQNPMRLADTLSTENEESCTTHNMLKISRNLFRWTKGVAYADHYERALTNGVLGIQRGTNPGVMTHLLPLGHAVSKSKTSRGWGTQFDTFWCTYGTGIDSFSKLGDSIYFEEEGGDAPGLFVMLYISSSLQWKAGLKIDMKVDLATSYNPLLNVTLALCIQTGALSTFTLNLRIPSWVSGGASAFYNMETLVVPSPGNFLTITKTWNSNDRLTLILPMAPRLEAIKDDRPAFATIQAILFGSNVLAGLTEDEWGIKTGLGPISDWLKPIPPSYNSQLISLSQSSGLVLAKTGLITMVTSPGQGTKDTVHATFRYIIQGQDPSVSISPQDAMGKPVMLEPFDLPGTLLVHQGKDKNLAIAEASTAGDASVFRFVPGLDGKPGTVSLVSNNLVGCYVFSAPAGESVKLNCVVGNGAPDFFQATSFVMQPGLSQYHPISFTATGPKRNYVMQPLNSLQDEFYNVYFDIKP